MIGHAGETDFHMYIYSTRFLWRENFIPSLMRLEHLGLGFLIHLHKGITIQGSVLGNNIFLIKSTIFGSKSSLK
jgi:hypothetical protein